jgi:hypothetical protein
VKVKLDGFKLSENISCSGVPPGIKRIMGILDKHSFKEILTTDQILSLAGLSYSYGCHLSHPILEDYRYKASPSRVFYGSKKTIAELRKINS